MWRWTGAATGASPSTPPGRRSATCSHRTGRPLLTRLVVEELVAQALAAAVKTDLGGRDGDAELIGDGLVREPVHVLEDHDLPERVRERVDRLGELRQAGAAVGDD